MTSSKVVPVAYARSREEHFSISGDVVVFEAMPVLVPDLPDELVGQLEHGPAADVPASRESPERLCSDRNSSSKNRTTETAS